MDLMCSGPAWRFAVVLFGLAALFGCAGPPPDMYFSSDRNPQIYPSNYRADTLSFMRTYLNNPLQVREAAMSEPALRTLGGRERYVACLRYNARNSSNRYTGTSDRLAVFFEGRFDQLIEKRRSFARVRPMHRSRSWSGSGLRPRLRREDDDRKPRQQQRRTSYSKLSAVCRRRASALRPSNSCWCYNAVTVPPCSDELKFWCNRWSRLRRKGIERKTTAAAASRSTHRDCVHINVVAQWPRSPARPSFSARSNRFELFQSCLPRPAGRSSGCYSCRDNSRSTTLR